MAPTPDTSTLHTRWGERIRALRTERGLSIMQVASQVGTDKGYLARIEAGEVGHRGPSDGMRMRIAGVFDVRVEDLFSYDPEDPCPSAASAQAPAPSPTPVTTGASRSRARSAPAPAAPEASDGPSGREGAA